MIKSKGQWNEKFKVLKERIKKPEENLPQIKKLVMELHDFTHEAEGDPQDTPGNSFWNIPGDMLRFSQSQWYSPAWHIWHSARIEDITYSYFILQAREIFYAFDFHKTLNIPFLHTGNSMDYQDMEIFNNCMDLEELRRYRQAVSIGTRKAINHLTGEVLKSKVTRQSLKEISETGSVAPADEWLLEYWGKKKVSGIVTMPLTRHLLVHMNSAVRGLK